MSEHEVELTAEERLIDDLADDLAMHLVDGGWLDSYDAVDAAKDVAPDLARFVAARLADAEARAEAAEAKVARVEELADEWETDDEESLNTFGQHLMGGAVISCAEHLREALRGDQ